MGVETKTFWSTLSSSWTLFSSSLSILVYVHDFTMILINMSKTLRHSTHRSLTSRLSCRMRACSSATSLNLILESIGTFSARLSKLIAPKAAMAAAANLEQKYTAQELISKNMQFHYILIDRFIFRPNFAGMRLPWGFHDQPHETNSRHYVTEAELPFFHNRRGILKINQSVKMPWHAVTWYESCLLLLIGS